MSNSWSEKTIIGLTGNIATGKSAIMRVAAQHGALTIDADAVAHLVLAENAGVREQISSTFGQRVLSEDGQINRAALGQIVFGDPAQLRKLEELTHPAIRERITQMVEASDASVVMIEAIKLLEGPLKELCDAVWVADCGKFLQLQRLIISRGLDEEQAFRRVMAQNPQADKVAQADVVIDTRGTLAQTVAQVEEAWETFGTQTLSEPVKAPVTEEDEHGAESAPAGGKAPAADTDVIVRRAKPSDIPSILLLIQKATGGKVKPKRAELLMALSERGYLIGQTDADVTAVVGWFADMGFASVVEAYIHPPEALETTGKAVLAEVKKTATELMCEAVFAFLDPDSPDALKALLKQQGFDYHTNVERWPLAWQQAYKDLKPESDRYLAVHQVWERHKQTS